MTTPLIMLGLLMGPFFVLRWVPRYRSRAAFRGTLGVTLMFLFTALGHFIKTEGMAEMIPPFVPARVALVYLTGLMEIVLAGLVLVPRWRRTVGWVLIGMLAGFLAVNIYAAVERVPFGGHGAGPVYLLVRVPLQIVVAGWIYAFCVKPADPRRA